MKGITKLESNNDSYVDLDFFSSKNNKLEINFEPEKKERKPRKTKTVEVGNEIVSTLTDKKDSSEENPYIKTYAETNAMLRDTIINTDILSKQLSEDIDVIRNSKTLKGKYTYLSNMTSALSSVMSTHLQAIREMNNSITQANNLNYKKMKDSSEADTNDDMKMMQMYSAFVNTPTGSYIPTNPLPNLSMRELSTAVNDNREDVNMVSSTFTESTSDNNLSPELNRMRLIDNPNIKTVVVMDQNTGRRYFDVVDQNGNRVENYPRPDNFLLEDTVIDIHNMIARNRNIDETWPLIMIGDATMNEY